MGRKVTTFKSINLLGETRREENDRLARERRKMVSKTIKRRNDLPDPLLLREVTPSGKFFLSGATRFQKKNRKRLLNGCRLLEY